MREKGPAKTTVSLILSREKHKTEGNRRRHVEGSDRNGNEMVKMRKKSDT